MMSDVTRFELDAEVRCSDGPCGHLRRVVIDPVARAVTHLVVEPDQRWGLGRLVPVDAVEAANPEVTLRCTRAEFEHFEDAEEAQFLPGASGEMGYGSGQMLVWPYYGLDGLAGFGGNTMQPILHDKVPLGEVEVRRGDQVHATDGNIGRVQGLVIDPRDHHVTHVLLQEGHLWGRKQVAIPISAVETVDDGIRLTLTKDDVQKLPEVDLDHGPLEPSAPLPD
jgi:sporulation protein YlmC with PRC-barrel domain